MINKIISTIILSLLIISCFSSCESSTDVKQEEDKTQIIVTETDLNSKIHSICKLATIEVTYHNVGTADVPKGDGINQYLQKDRQYWIEYTGTAKLGIDSSKIEAKIDGENITIKMPKAQILGDVSWDSSNAEEFVTPGSIISGTIPSDLKDDTVNNSQTEMKKQILSNNNLCVQAEDNAKKIIESYVDKMSVLNGIEYNIIWETVK